jgi:hypothetical protein
MVNVTIGYTVQNCAPTTCALTVASNEAVDAHGSGNTAPDWNVIDATHVELRAERAGPGSGRIYTVTITCTDQLGQAAQAQTTVKVPHDQRRRGPH